MSMVFPMTRFKYIVEGEKYFYNIKNFNLSGLDKDLLHIVNTSINTPRY